MSADKTPDVGGGMPVIKYWAEKTISADGVQIWQKLLHKSACLSCAWGTGGQKGGFVNEDGEVLQRCAKSIEAIASELQAATYFEQQYTLTQLQELNSQSANNLGRLSHPLILRSGSSQYERISWDEVYQIAEIAFRKSPQRIASYSSGRSSNEAAFLLQLMMRSLDSNNLADCSDLCHAASTVGLKQMFGSGTSMVSLESLKQSDCIVLIGSNAPANHPRLMNELIKLRERGGKVIIVNPTIEVGLVKFASPAYPIKSMLAGGSEISSLYLQPIPGSDVALFVGIQKSLIAQNLIKPDFLKAYTEDWENIIKYAESTSWETITATCGISQSEINAAAQIIGTSTCVVFAWAMGVTQQENGVDNIYSIANTALLTGNAGKPGAGTMPIRGHSNVQGFGSMGVTIHLKKEIQQALEKLLQRPLSRILGYDTRALITAAEQGEVDTLICLGGNLYAANPNLNQAKQALGKIKTIFYVATKPNLGHFHGLAKQNTIILPVFTRFENPHKTTIESGNNFVRLNDVGTTHLKDADLISEIELIVEIAHRVLGDDPVNWRKLQDPKYVRELIAKTIPGYEKIATIDNVGEEFTISGRIFNEPKFATDTGKAKMFVTDLPNLNLPSQTDFGLSESIPGIVLILGTGRSYSQHNTVVYKDGDYYRGIPHRNCILMNHDDIEKAGFRQHQRVTVQGDAGKLENVEIICGEIRQGAAMMFYPEVNVIFQAKIDPHSGTPAYKRVPVFVYQE
ncbi:FdhF/YdeP family oxidoreductase [Anabaena cylindrica FACHB-243]|uniref:Oxidoreductase alpha (Molybdopterin) subunit n=1 Tax=Anabaena cylindrica (strain ATCC 27899 / PCC 7122) TaxID=272123 RepID=K9ZMR5_ANACC|nr:MULTISPECIES: FdhF/YdeP family oxidoreductase [Anabaena]AFZ59610.1 oxidoreductase alpha (molybdopterin) subunit [Anabaena cylindrica PCC 7122]MBD2418726.1 FdhF/YdeP family oxidoreductase [Anabaena cylindrica FACHB-243]MBY5281647.1 FdhF/YdeP family oxidoreductase [Anabaena sp. CCAP 1446/1C]MBY5309173.1 FdhF/YdeP family oxidoreductase [Anabaena sp. CCAP 1446/1C]MCM2406289.1 FdhF/YdeP family oxidoreductase [Anabaena sp. CCAP 1446/1C]